ncbi:XdhC family protein [Glutamicibacter nicotianae]|uniref:Xanthine dehydrogenase n=1 Tax=Glutamicibacter nicotianae TaxID=37929 RepID=A0ABQ0RQA5_GLUNI|nr:XdhC family protein [Glutamicibacter nicotianae]GEC14001.1 xanthine dehydrogenase [Glutamicibacter nicotianae]
MRDVIEAVATWTEQGESFALATVVNTSQSAPRPAGASMAIGMKGEAVGSVSGGCVEGAVYQLGQEAIEDGVPVLQRFGYSDDDAFAVGLTCGGIIDVFIERLTRQSFPELPAVIADIEVGNPVATATVVEHPQPERIGKRLVVWPERASGTLGSPHLDHAVIDDARGLLAAGESTLLMYGHDGERMETGAKIFVSSYQPKPRMIIFGAIDFAAAVAQAGSMIGFEVTVCDAREVFATVARFPSADEVVVSWPHAYLQQELAKGKVDIRTVICVLTHDPKFDVPVLDIALRLEGSEKPAYIGVMGSRKTHHDRLARLQDAGINPAQLAQMHSPIGLDLGGRTPEETAISVVAEIIAERWGGTGRPLKNLVGTVHSHSA